MRGTTNIVGTEFTFNILGVGARQNGNAPPASVFGLGELIDSVHELQPREFKSFSKWVHAAFGGQALHALDYAAMRRVEAYLDAIQARRTP